MGSSIAIIFSNAKILDNSEIYSWDGSITDHKGKIPGTNIRIVETPGHDPFHCSVLIDTQKFGTVAVVADVFWWSDEEEQKTERASLLSHKDPYVKKE